jgi:acyl dehydratase
VPINPDAVGFEGQPMHHEWTSKDAILYALGVGCGAQDPASELEFTTENSNGVTQQVLPTMAVVLGMGGGSALAGIGPFNPAMLVHGEQRITLHRPIPVEGAVDTTGKITAIYDKGKGALVEMTSTSVDTASGEPMFTNVMSAFIRGEGDFGGDRGPSGPRNEAPDTAPAHTVTYPTRIDQALLYRLSGDRNPLHSDPTFAAMGGFDRPILHGLCTYGFSGRALLHAVCDGDPTRFTGMEGRFTSPVLPGEELTVSIWPTGDGEAVFRTAGADGRTVIDNGLVTFT